MGSHPAPTDLSWSPPPRCLTLPDEGVHVWLWALDLSADVAQRLLGSLAKDEIARAGRFHRETDRMRFIVGRGLLKVLLARYLNVRPGDIRFQSNRWGKPYLPPASHPSAPLFNFSHSHGLALCALSRDRMVGVDIELVRPSVAYADIAERFFSIREIEALAAQPEPMRRRAFFSCWTQKEAFVKALGQGLTIPLNRFDVSVGSPVPTSVTSEGWSFTETTRWSLRELNLGADYVGAIAVEGEIPQVQCWTWEDYTRSKPPLCAADYRSYDQRTSPCNRAAMRLPQTHVGECSLGNVMLCQMTQS